MPGAGEERNGEQTSANNFTVEWSATGEVPGTAPTFKSTAWKPKHNTNKQQHSTAHTVRSAHHPLVVSVPSSDSTRLEMFYVLHRRASCLFVLEYRRREQTSGSPPSIYLVLHAIQVADDDMVRHLPLPLGSLSCI